MWCDDNEKVEWWYKAAFKAAVKAGAVWHEPTGEYASDPKMLELVSIFVQEYHPLEQYETGNLAMADFMTWLGAAKPEVKAGEQQVFTVQIAKNYGDTSVTFGYSATFTTSNENERQQAFKVCQWVIAEQFKEFERNELFRTAPPPQSMKTTAYPHEDFVYTSIEVENKSGKLYYKLKGGKYEKFGVRVWPEVLKAAGVNPDQFQPGTYPLTGKAVVMMVEKEGRLVPKNVLQLIL